MQPCAELLEPKTDPKPRREHFSSVPILNYDLELYVKVWTTLTRSFLGGELKEETMPSIINQPISQPKNK